MESPHEPFRRRGKEMRERVFALLALIPLSPVFLVCALAIKLEGLLDREARGPVFFTEDRISRGRRIGLFKFRTLTASALASLGPGPTHIALLEMEGKVTRAGRAMRRWYLDELPQLLNIVKGDMFLIGTRPAPFEYYQEEMTQGITRKRDMPAGLIGPVQAAKGSPDYERSVELDREYWDAFRTFSAWKLLLLDLRILARSLRTQLEHKGV
jgi:lipopolysaccharide/colanic/teichoic acid biosynthesis glycosyltransferase